MIEAILGSVVGVLKWLGGLLFKSRAVSHAQAREHDVALFRKGDATVNESFLNDLLNSDLYNHWCRYEAIRDLGHFCEDYLREENQFLDPRVRKAARKAIGKLDEVDRFVGQHFFRSPRGREGMLRLYPELREAAEDERRTLYQRRASELTALTGEAWRAYKEYRATVKKRLMV